MELISKYPLNPALVTKINLLEEMAAGQFPGWAENLEASEEKFNYLRAEAQKAENQGDLQSAIDAWTTVLGLQPLKGESITQASGKIGQLRINLA